MNKEELEKNRRVIQNNKAELTLLASEANEKLVDYKVQISLLEKEIEDLGKPEVTPEFLDKISETITEAVENLDLDDGVKCDFEIDYDNRIAMSDIRFEDTHGIAEKIYCAVELLFAEVSSDILEAQKADQACN